MSKQTDTRTAVARADSQQQMGMHRMKTTTEYNAKGGFRFRHHEPLPIGKYFLHMGEKVKLVGPGMAGMPEVESEDGSTNYAFPHDLTPCEDASVHTDPDQRPGRQPKS